MESEGILGGVVALIFVIILGYAFTQVFLALPGGLGWAILFVVPMIAVTAGIVISIIKSLGE